MVAAGIGGKENDMKRKDIEKAAGDYSGSSLGFTDNNSVMAKHKAFVDGAKWRINSVWHDINEIPEDGRIIVLLGKYGTMIIYGPNMMYYREAIIMDGWFLKWAYKEDLIPNMEE